MNKKTIETRMDRHVSTFYLAFLLLATGETPIPEIQPDPEKVFDNEGVSPPHSCPGKCPNQSTHRRFP